MTIPTDRELLRTLYDGLIDAGWAPPQEAALGRALFAAAYKWSNDPHALADLDHAVEEYRQYAASREGKE